MAATSKPSQIQQEQLAPVPLRQELAGRLRNISKLKYWQMAVAEAVKNSMDAIEESDRPGKIEIIVERGKDLASSGNSGKPVKSVVVRDNGIGFNESNFISFCTPDSLQKQKRGGKGLGRLSCLQAFERIRVHSVYKNGSWKERKVVLQCESPELAATSESSADSTVFSTEVRLENLRPEFDSTSAIDANSLAEWLAEHFLPALVERPKWLESLTLIDGKEHVDLTRVIEGGAEWVQKFKVGNYDFRATCYVIKAEEKKDMVRLVAGGRIVNANTQPLNFYLPHLSNIDADSSHVVLISSPFFDEHVNDARNGVTFADEGDTGFLSIKASDFREACANAFMTSLEEQVKQSDERFKSRITNVVSKEAPYYRPLLLGFFASKEFSSLNASAKDEEILNALDSYKRGDAVKLKQESRRLSKLKSEGDDYWESARKLAGQIETQKKVALAEYVSLRKIVLDRLEDLLAAKGDGKPHREAAIHNLIFPQRSDTESNPGVDHQLWILDERLESHDYLASDKPMDRGKGDRPDLLIALDRPSAFACEPASVADGYDKIVLVEFKQALRDLATVPTDELPHQQMIRYAGQIEDEKARHLKSNRPIKVKSNARFYLYAVCEFSAGLRKRLIKSGFTPSPTGDGAFWVTNEGRYYIEYISLLKLLEDAQARNSAFFRRLGLEA